MRRITQFRVHRVRTTSFDGTVRSGWHADSGRVNRRTPP